MYEVLKKFAYVVGPDREFHMANIGDVFELLHPELNEEALIAEGHIKKIDQLEAVKVDSDDDAPRGTKAVKPKGKK